MRRPARLPPDEKKGTGHRPGCPKVPRTCRTAYASVWRSPLSSPSRRLGRQPPCRHHGTLRRRRCASRPRPCKFRSRIPCASASPCAQAPFRRTKRRTTKRFRARSTIRSNGVTWRCPRCPERTGANSPSSASGERVHLCSGILARAGRILLVASRYPNHATPLWNLPGGRQRPGELLEAALRREFLEETGLSVAVERLLYISESYDRATGAHFLN